MRARAVVTVAVSALLCIPAAHCWILPRPPSSSTMPYILPTQSRPRSTTSTTTALFVEAFNLESTQLSDNHEQVGQELAESLQRMLDTEWMPQTVHAAMGRDVREAYVECRQSGDADVASILISVADRLNENWDRYNAEAFVSAWDCANYASDWLTTNAGAETCECSQKIY